MASKEGPRFEQYIIWCPMCGAQWRAPCIIGRQRTTNISCRCGAQLGVTVAENRVADVAATWPTGAEVVGEESGE